MRRIFSQSGSPLNWVQTRPKQNKVHTRGSRSAYIGKNSLDVNRDGIRSLAVSIQYHVALPAPPEREIQCDVDLIQSGKTGSRTDKQHGKIRAVN